MAETGLGTVAEILEALAGSLGSKNRNEESTQKNALIFGKMKADRIHVKSRNVSLRTE
jgi:hypothetical protein